MCFRAWGDGNALGKGKREKGKGKSRDLSFPLCPLPLAPCPMPHAPCPMPNTQCPIKYVKKIFTTKFQFDIFCFRTCDFCE